MSKSKIEWTDRTWNVTTGCTKVSPGCANCYAERQTVRMALMHPKKYGQGFKQVLPFPQALAEPFTYRKPQRIFVNSMSDLFHKDVPEDYILQVFLTMAANPHLTFQVLTKRPERMADFMKRKPWFGKRATLGKKRYTFSHSVLPNVWIGTSVENQTTADERLPHLLAAPAAIRFVSCEPMLGPVDFNLVQLNNPECYKPWCGMDGKLCMDCVQYRPVKTRAGELISWIIVGGESGPGARRMEAEWAVNVREQCRDAGVAFFFKQGSQANWPDYKNQDSFPTELRVRDFPVETAVRG